MRLPGLVGIFLVAATAGLFAQPKDFRIVARFGSGHIPVTEDDPARGDIAAWCLRLDASGVAKIEVFRNASGMKTITSVKYSSQNLDVITNTIKGTQFFALPSRLDGGLSDVPSYGLEVTMNGKIHRVAATALGNLKDKKSLRRFASVWVAACRKMPPKLDHGATLDLQDISRQSAAANR
jgi:hypothetical protein